MNIREIWVAVSLNLASIRTRPGDALATVAAVTLAVMVLLTALSMAQGFKSTVDNTGSDTIAVMTRAGASSDLTSVIPQEQARLLATAPGIATSASGGALLSPEVYVTIDGIKRSTGSKVNLALRGVGVHGPALRGAFKIVDGRMFSPGANEVIVGEAAAREFIGFEVGSTVAVGSQRWRVVGIFTVPGTVFDSEVWTDAEVAQSFFGRGPTYQTVRARLASAAALPVLKDWIARDPRLQLETFSEREFFSAQSEQLTSIILWLGWPLSIAIALGALAGAINSVFASVETRSREIATLRCIGFRGISVFAGVLCESIFLSLAGGLVGVVLALVILDGMTASTLGSDFSQIVFAFTVSPLAILTAFALATLIGVAGGVFPALRAARAPLSKVGLGQP